MATMKEVADRAGVSVATVSRVVNQSGYVRVALQERVREAMRDLRYHPSALARSLRRQETLTVGLLLPQLDQPFFSRVAFVIVQALFKHNYRTLVCSSEEDPAQEDAYIDMLIRQRVDGVIVAPTGRNQSTRMLVEQGVPIVLFDRDMASLNVSKVFSDHRQGGYLALKHLIDLGHKKIAIIGKDDTAASLAERIEGAQKALAEAGLKGDVYLELLDSDADPYRAGYDLAKHVLQKDEASRPTAIFAVTDVSAVGALRGAAEVGMNVPNDVSIIGYDDVPLARQCIPALTTIAQPTDAMGQQAVDVLMAAIIKGNHTPVEVVLETHLVVRESTKALSR
jgi:LacI family transcriptional regulator